MVVEDNACFSTYSHDLNDTNAWPGPEGRLCNILFERCELIHIHIVCCVLGGLRLFLAVTFFPNSRRLKVDLFFFFFFL